MSLTTDNFDALVKDIPQNVRLVAVSKTYPAAAIKELYDHGHKIFGENRVQEWKDKKEVLPVDIEWHLIGHLQTNKVKYLVPGIQYIHSIDSVKLYREIAARCEKEGVQVHCLLQIHIASEETKFGLSRNELEELCHCITPQQQLWAPVAGVMGMATFTDDVHLIRREFRELAGIFRELKQHHFTGTSFSEISMGMSGDYRIAIEEGATIIRIGSTIFGRR